MKQQVTRSQSLSNTTPIQQPKKGTIKVEKTDQVTLPDDTTSSDDNDNDEDSDVIILDHDKVDE